MKIWSAWLQGRANAPKHVRQIFDLWEKLNPEAEFVVLEQAAVDAILAEMRVSTKNMTPQVKTNVVRLYLIAKHGGTWVDSTLLPTIPLDDWLTDGLKQKGFFAFRSTGHPDLVLQNWFLFAKKGNELVLKWLEYYCDYFRTPRYPAGSRKIFLSLKILDYFIYRRGLAKGDPMYFIDPFRHRSCSMYPYAAHNYTLAYLLKNNEILQSLWSEVPKHYHTRPSLIGHLSSDPETIEETFLEVAGDLLGCAPLHKLNHHDERFSILIDRAIKSGSISICNDQ